MAMAMALAMAMAMAMARIMTNPEVVGKYLKRYWGIRNGKYGKHLRPTIHFIVRKLRERVPRGEWNLRILEQRV